MKSDKDSVDGSKPRIDAQLRDVAREYLRLSPSGQDLIQPRLSEQGFPDIAFGSIRLKGRPLLSGWVTVSITTSQLPLVEQGRTDEVDDIHLALHDRGLQAVASVQLTPDGTSLAGWENVPLADDLSPTEKLRWLHSGMVANLEAWVSGHAESHESTPGRE